MDGIVFTKAKPSKDWDDALQQAKSKANENLMYASTVLSEKSKNIKETVQSGQAFNKMKESSINASNSMAQKKNELSSQMAQSETYQKFSAGTSNTVSRMSVGAASLQEKVKSK